MNPEDGRGSGRPLWLALASWAFQLVLSEGTRLLSTRRYHSAIRKLMG